MKANRIAPNDPAIFRPVTGVDEAPPSSNDADNTSGFHSQEELCDELEDAACDSPAVLEDFARYNEHLQKEMEGMLTMIEESNQKIQQAAESFKCMYPEPRSVPAILGLKVNAASGLLCQSELRVGRVCQEYHNNVPAGHIIRQVPAPGGSLSKNGRVQIVISKGPPPEQEKHDVIRQREKVSDGSGTDPVRREAPRFDSGESAASTQAPAVEAAP